MNNSAGVSGTQNNDAITGGAGGIQNRIKLHQGGTYMGEPIIPITTPDYLDQFVSGDTTLFNSLTHADPIIVPVFDGTKSSCCILKIKIFNVEDEALSSGHNGDWIDNWKLFQV